MKLGKLVISGIQWCGEHFLFEIVSNCATSYKWSSYIFFWKIIRYAEKMYTIVYENDHVDQLLFPLECPAT